jgi:hypothetical protein
MHRAKSYLEPIAKPATAVVAAHASSAHVFVTNTVASKLLLVRFFFILNLHHHDLLIKYKSVS